MASITGTKRNEESKIKVQCEPQYKEFPTGSTALRFLQQYSCYSRIVEYIVTDVKKIISG